MAGRIPQHFIDQLLNRIDIVDLIDGYVPLKKAGANYKANCPFHGEKTPSFTVSPSKQFYHCFGCGANGTAISFLMDYDHMEFREAIEKLASAAGLEIPSEAEVSTKKQSITEGVDLYQLMSQVRDFYQLQLRQHADKAQAVEYLKQRGLSGDIAKRFAIGFAPEGWDNLMSQLGTSAQAKKALLDTGMLTQNEKKRVYDRFRHRIMFPIADHRGRVVGFGGRVLGEGEPKYLNSPETPIFHKGAELYNLFGARGAIKEADSVLVVEGYMDVVALAQAGIDNAVATLGTATTAMHLQRLFRYTQNVVFCFDGDRAGKAAAWKALETALPSLQDGYQLSFLFLPDGEDPDSMVRKIGKNAFQELVDKATPLPDFLLDTLQQKADIKRLDGRAKLVKLANPMIAKLPDGILKTLLVDRLAKLAQVSPSDLTAGGRRRQGDDRRSKTRASAPASRETITNIRRALSLILQHPRFANEFEELQEIRDEHVRGIEMLHTLRAACDEQGAATTATLLERFRDRPYFNTLVNLANHQHNNIPELSEQEALALIRANNQKIIEEFKGARISAALESLAALDQKSRITPLDDDERAEQAELTDFVRKGYQS